jgi:hypothetical protein
MALDFLFGFRNWNSPSQPGEEDAYTISCFRSDMYQELLRRLVDVLKRASGMEQRLPPKELHQLAEAIIDYGRIEAQEGCSASPPLSVIVEVRELAYRFRETPDTIKDALMLLREMGRAEHVHRHGYWKLKLAGTFRQRGRKDKGDAASA